MSDDKHRILKGIRKGLGELGSETLKKTAEHSEKIFESVITAKELLGLDNTMSQSELDFQKREDERRKEAEIKKIKGEMGQGETKNDGEKQQMEKKRDVEGEMEELRDQKEKEEEEKERYYERVKEQQKIQEQQQQAEYDGLMMESSNPAKQKKSRGSAFIQGKKKKSQPTQSQMSQTSEFKGKID